jgi:transposase InsO family protein
MHQVHTDHAHPSNQRELTQAPLSRKFREKQIAEAEVTCEIVRKFVSRRNAERETIDRFIAEYNANEVIVSAEARARYRSIVKRTFERWLRKYKRSKLEGLKVRYGNRAGTGLIDTQSELRDFIVLLLKDKPFLGASQIRKAIRAQFQETGIGIPSRGTITRWIGKWKTLNPSEFLRAANPDAWKGRYRVSLGDASADITEPLQLVEIDGSPADILCLDGRRYYMTAAIDVASRLAVAVISKTATAEAAMLAVRKLILKYGVPAAIKFDRGQEFESRRFQAALAHLDIEAIELPPFSGDRKPHVERFIGTTMHSFMPLHGGYIGSNVTERRAIESRKAFAARLGKGREKVFQVALTPEDLASKLDEWIENQYSTRPHRGLRGETPARQWGKAVRAGWKPRRVESRALDVLLSYVGERVVRRDGIAFERGKFWDDELIAHIGRRVRICAGNDFGELHVFDASSGDFLAIARDFSRLGIERREVAIAARAAQTRFIAERRAEDRRLRRRFSTAKVAAAIAELAAEKSQPLATPEEIELHDTPAIRAAIEAVRSADKPKLIAHDSDQIERGDAILREMAERNSSSWPDDGELLARYARIVHGEPLTPRDLHFLKLAGQTAQTWRAGFERLAEFNERISEIGTPRIAAAS